MVGEWFAQRPVAREVRHDRRLGGGLLEGELVPGRRRCILFKLQLRLIDEGAACSER
jgi:hypothetical protein